ncbi:MAG: TlpA family protein disulfide reductase [Prevotellaceae bacterium]|jgi:thiol-disulfide isomerase/thioredoxin|nr:TlpA family protein disulfide reductase [Prevotellaceae bacterium]
MKSKSVALFALLLSAIVFSCSQEKTVELPLTMQNGYGPFRMAYGGESAYSEAENNPWKNTYLNVSKLPEGLTDLKLGDIETNIYQTVYQAYLSGNITRERYEELQKSWDWTPDTVNLSKTPVKTKIAFAYGKDPDGILKVVVDANNNLDLTDDKSFTPLEMNVLDAAANKDSMALEHAVNVSFETFTGNEIVPVHVPLFIMYSESFGMFLRNFAQYATTRFEGEQIAVSSGHFTNLRYNDISVAFMRNDPESGETVKEADLYRKNEYIEIKREIYRIAGVNTNKSTLVLEKTGLPKEQLFSTQIGYKSHLFRGEEFTTKSAVSPDSLRGKYVLLDFWATWCSPCIQEMPHLKELYAKTDRAKFEIVGIVGASQLAALTDAIDKHAITWPQIFSDDANRITETYGISGYPTTFLIDPEGIIVAKDLTGNALEEKVLSLIGE